LESNMNDLKTLVNNNRIELIPSKLEEISDLESKLNSQLNKIINKIEFQGEKLKLTSSLINLKNTVTSIIQSSGSSLKQLNIDIASVKKTLDNIKKIFARKKGGTMRDSVEFLLFLFM